LERNAFVIASILTILITYLSLTSLDDLNIQISASDKILHALAYFVLCSSWYFAIIRIQPKFKYKIIITIAVFAFGCLLEFLQGMTAQNRVADFYDIFANTLGIILAFTSFNYLMKVFQSI
jgi:glycopeptide antibiotics resistance protein